MANAAVTLVTSITPSSTGADGKLLTFPYYSEKTRGAGYYGVKNALHTVQYSTTNNFVGKVKLQGSLITDPSDTDWYDIPETVLGNGISPVFNQALLITFKGNHVWVRAVIETFVSGSINNILLTQN